MRNMKKSCLQNAYTFVCILYVAVFSAQTEGVSIRNSPAAPDKSAMLDVVSTNKGMLIPRVNLTSNTDVTNVPNPANSLLVFYTGSSMSGGLEGPGYYYWDVSLNPDQWKKIATGPELWKRMTTNSNNIFYDGGNVKVGANSGTPTYNLDVERAGSSYSGRFYSIAGEMRTGSLDANWATAGYGHFVTQTSKLDGEGKYFSMRFSQDHGNGYHGYNVTTWYRPNNMTSPGWVTIDGNNNGTWLTSGREVIVKSNHTWTPNQPGVILQNGSQSWAPFSDSTYKRDINDETSVLARLQSCRPVTYNLKVSAEGPLQHGFIAQEMESIFPELVLNFQDHQAENADETVTKKALNYNGLISVLVKAVQEQQVLIQDLQNRVAELENR
jgi:hypothetical protein